MAVFKPSSMSTEDALNTMRPARSARNITLGETDIDLVLNGKSCIGLFIGTGGDVVVVHADDLDDDGRETTVTYKVSDAFFLSGNFARIKSDTTATDIVAQY